MLSDEALPVAAGKKVLRVAAESAPVLLQTGTAVAATNEVPWAGRTITGRKGGMDITSLFICNRQDHLWVPIEHIKYSMKPRGDLIVSKWGLKRTKLLIERQGGMYWTILLKWSVFLTEW